jgi:hypothetical protein
MVNIDADPSSEFNFDRVIPQTIEMQRRYFKSADYDKDTIKYFTESYGHPPADKETLAFVAQRERK